MRRIAILIVAAGLSAVGTTPAAAQLPEAPLPDVQVPDLEVPDVELPEFPDGDGGGSDPDSPVETPSISDGSASGGSGGSGGGGSADSGGAGLGGSSGLGSGSGGLEGGGEDSCPCAARATGYPVAGDYDKCPEQDGAPRAATDELSSVLATSRSESSGGDADRLAGEVLGAGASGEDASEPPSADAASLSEDSGASPFAWALLGLVAVTLLIGLAGGLRAFVGRRG
jgi:hypothetical protein